MTSHATLLADFYQQLGLLVRSKMPLPDGLAELGRQVRSRGFKEALEDVTERVNRGEKLSEATAAHPTYFSPLHTRLIAIGEDTGALSEMLFSVSRLTRFGHMLVTTLRDVVSYPLLAIHMALLVGLGLSIIVVPAFVAIFDDMFMGQSLPGLTRLVCKMAMVIHAHRLIAIGLFAASLAFSIWLLLPGRRSHAVLLKIVNALPGSWSILCSMDMARICRVWSACLRRGVPMGEAIEMCAGVVQSKRMRHAIQKTAREVDEGASPREVLAAEPGFDQLLPLTFAHTPEAGLAEELGGLAELYEHRVALSARAASAAWSILAIILMTLIVAAVVIAAFLPMISITANLSG